MKIITFIISLLILFGLIFLLLLNISVLNQLDGKEPIIKSFNYENITDKIKGKNFLANNIKTIIVNKYIISQDTKISGVVELNGKKKNFNNQTLRKLKSISGIGTIYITKIGDIDLGSVIVLNDYQGNTIISSSVEEKEKKTKK